jgi:tetratricopeptide (TPR) repeat protein
MKKFFTLSLFLLLSGQLAISQNAQKPAQNAHDESIEIFVTATKFLKAKKYDEASIFLDRAIAKDPSNYHFWYERGRCYLKLKNDEKALSCFKRVVDLKPDYADGHLMLGYIYMNMHKLTEAIHSYDKAFAHESSPSNRLAQKMTIIMLYDRMDKLGQAERHIEDAKALHIENPLLFYYDGKLKNQHKKYKEAKEALLRAVAHLPKENDKTATATKEENAIEELGLSHQDKTPAEQSKYYYELYVAN